MDTAGTGLIVEGLWLMVIGMTIVYAFLMMLVGFLTLMSKAVARWLPEEPLPALSSMTAPTPPATGDARLGAVIAAALQAHRQRHHP